MIQICAFLLPAIPLLILLAFLVLGCYPGHEAIVRLSDRIARRGRRGAAAASPSVLRPPTRAASGGLLLAFALSGRAPPVAP